MDKKIKIGLLISGVSIAILGGGIGIGYAIHHGVNQSKYYNLEEQKIIKYRTDFLEQQYNRLVENTNKNCQEYGGWKSEYDEVLKKRVNSPYENLDINKRWYEDWQPYKCIDPNYKFKDGEIYLCDPVINFYDDDGNSKPIIGYIDPNYIVDWSDRFIINVYDLIIQKFNINYDINDPSTYDPILAYVDNYYENNPIIIYK